MYSIKNDRARKKKIYIRFYLITVSAVIIFFAVLRCAYLIREDFQAQLEQNLEDVAYQDAMALENQITARYNLLRSVAARTHLMGEKRGENVSVFQTLVDENDLRRVGYCSPEGDVNTTDGKTGNLAFRDFFQQSMQGKAFISSIMEDVLEEDRSLITVMSTPILDDAGEPEGVMYLTYKAEDFSNELPVNSFDGAGHSYVINQAGQIMVSSGNSNSTIPIARNLFTEILPENEKNGPLVTTLISMTRQEKDSSGKFFLGDTEHYYYFTPVNLMDGSITWYVFTTVPTEYFQTRFEPVQRNLLRMTVLVFIILMTCFLIIQLSSIQQRRAAYRLAYESSVTGGLNLYGFFRNMQLVKEPLGYIVSMNLRNFGHASVAAGKEASDKLIQEIWNCIEKNLTGKELACHDEKDKFVMYLESPWDKKLEERLSQLSEQIHDCALKNNIPWLRPKFGIYYLKETETVEEGYSKARLARKEAKDSDNWAYYDEFDHQKEVMNQQLEERFDDALKNEEFEVWYQPKYNAETRQITGAEALVRWRIEEDNLIYPDKFIPMLERNGKIAQLDEYVFRKTCRYLRKWRLEGHDIKPVSVNVSRASLYRQGIVDDYCNILQEEEMDSSLIQLEVTERSVAGNENLTELLRQFRNRGIQILMDDFGSGYSSLATLNMKCFDTLKLDKSLIDYIGEKNGDTLVYYVIKMGRKLGLHITAEGVETEQQLAFLQKASCDDIQGYLFSRPIKAEQYEKLLSGPGDGSAAH